MVKLNLYLDKRSGEKPVAILHTIYYKNKRFRISTGYRVAPKDWDSENQQVKRSRANFKELNRILGTQKNDIERICFQLQEKNKPITRETVGTRLTFAVQTEKQDYSPLGLFETFIKEYGTDKAERTVKGYKTALNYLKKYFEDTSTPALFSNLENGFYNSFKNYLDKYDNTFGQHIKNVKIFMGWAYEKQFLENQDYKKWKVTNEDGKDKFYLEPKEIEAIENVVLNESLDKVRDLFLIGCNTGLRVSDIMNLKPSHYKEGIIRMTTQKTTEPVIIPATEKLKAILDKYWGNNMLLPKISNQKGNEYLKKIGEMAGIDRDFNHVQIKNKKQTETVKPGFKNISWHVARHSFITNAVHKGMNQQAIMKIVAHKSNTMLQRYIQNNPNFLISEIEKLN